MKSVKHTLGHKFTHKSDGSHSGSILFTILIFEVLAATRNFTAIDAIAIVEIMLALQVVVFVSIIRLAISPTVGQWGLQC